MCEGMWFLNNKYVRRNAVLSLVPLNKLNISYLTEIWNLINDTLSSLGIMLYLLIIVNYYGDQLFYYFPFYPLVFFKNEESYYKHPD